MSDITWNDIENDIRAHIGAVISEVSENCEGLIKDELQDFDDESSDISRFDVYDCAKELFNLYEQRVFDKDIYDGENDEIVVVDRLYHLVALNGEIKRWWQSRNSSQVSPLLRLLQWHNAQNDIHSYGFIRLGPAAEIAGVKKNTLRSMMYSAEHPSLVPAKDGNGKAVLSYPEFKTWLRGRRNVDWASVEREGSGMIAGLHGVDSRARPDAANLRRLMIEKYGLRPHRAMDPANKRMHVYCDPERNFVVAHEYDRVKQKLWLRQDTFGNLPTSLPDIKYRLYAGRDTALDGSEYGRHSGLRKYEELATADLIAVTPLTMNEADQVLSHGLS